MNLKKLFATSAVFALAVSLFAPAINTAKAEYNAEIKGAYSYAASVGITTMPTVDAAFPMGKAIRGHVAKMISNWTEKVLEKTADTTITPTFTDIAKESVEIQGYIVKSAQLKLMGQGGNEFRPQANVTRAEFGTLLSRALWGEVNNGGTPFYAKHLEALKKAGVMTDLTNPERPVLRYEIWLMLQRAADLKAKTDAATDGLTPEQLLGCLSADDYLACIADAKKVDDKKDDKKDDNEEVKLVKKGNLAIKLSKKTPDSDKLPKGAQGVKVATFTVEAGKSDVDLVNAKMSLKGMGVDAVKDVALFTENGRVSKAKAFNSDDEATVNFSPSLTIKGGEKIELTAVVSTKTSANYGDDFALSLDDMVTTAKDVDADYPIRGEKMEIGSVEATSIKITFDGAVSAPKLGQTDAEVLKFKIENNTKKKEDVTLKQITLKETGTIDEEDELANFTLWNDGKEVASTKKTEGKYLTFDLDKKVTIEDGKTEKFVVKADITGGASKNFAFVLDKGLDVDATASKYGYISVENDLTNTSAITIKAGAISIKAVEPKDEELRKDKDNVVLGGMDIKVNAGKDLELQKFKVIFDNKKLPVKTPGVGHASAIVEANAKNEVTVVFKQAGDIKVRVNGQESAIIGAKTNNTTTAGLIKTSIDTIASNANVTATIVGDKVTLTSTGTNKKVIPTFEVVQLGAYVDVTESKTAYIAPVAEVSKKDAVYYTLDEVLENVELYDGKTVYDLTLNNAGYAYDNDLSIALKDGKTTELRVRADIKDVNIQGLSFNLKFEKMGATNGADLFIVELDNDNQVTDIVPTTVSLNKVDGEMSAATLTVLPLSTTKNAVVGSSNIELSKFEVQAGKSSDLEIKDVKFGATVNSVAADFNNTVVSQVKLYKDSVSEKNLLKAKSSSDLVNGKITFDNVNVDVKKDSKVTFFVTVDVVDDTNLASKTIKASDFVISDLTIEDSDNDNVKAVAGSTLANARTVTIQGYGTINVTNTTKPENLDDIKDVVAGNSAIVAGFETTTLQESAVIKELTIGGVNVNAIKEVVLLDKDMKEVAKETVAGANVKFDNLSLNVKEGSDKIFVKVVTNKIGKDRIGQVAAAQSITMTFVEVEGKDSGKDLVLPGVATAAATFNVVPVSVVTAKVSDAPQILAAGIILANVKFDKVNNDNTDDNGVALKTYLKSFKVKGTTFTNLSGDVKLNVRKKGSSTDLLAQDIAINQVDQELTFVIPNTVKESEKEITSASTYEVVVKSYDIADSKKNASLGLTLISGVDSIVLATDSDLNNTVNVNVNDTISFGIAIENK